jgi:hypothetical protein
MSYSTSYTPSQCTRSNDCPCDWSNRANADDNVRSTTNNRSSTKNHVCTDSRADDNSCGILSGWVPKIGGAVESISIRVEAARQA